MRRILRTLVILCLGVLCSNNAIAQHRPEIKIGAILPLSGDARAFAEEARQALQHALEDTKKTKFEYRLIFEDDRFSAAAASSAAQKLASVDNVQALFSNWSYGGTAAASALKGRNVINLAFAWDPAVTAIGDNSFIIAPPPGELAKAAVHRIKAEGGKRIAIIQMQESGGEFAQDEVERACREAGIEVVKRERVAFNDFGALKGIVTRVKELKVDYLVATLTFAQYLEVFRTMKLLKFDVPVACLGQTPESGEFSKMHPTVWWSADYSASADAHAKISNRTGLKDLAGYTAYYDSMRALIETFETSPFGGDIPSASWLMSALSEFSSGDSYLGKFSFTNRVRQSSNVLIVDQAAKYR